jgi:hypothetical protein
MNRIQRLMKLHKLLDQAGEGGSDTGGTGTGTAGAGAGEGGAAAGGEGGEGGQKSGDEPGASGGEGGGEGGTGKPALSDADAKLLKEVMAQKNRAKDLAEKLADAQKRLADYDGVDATKARKLLADQEEADRKAAESRGEYDRLVAQMGERHQSEQAALNGRLGEAQTHVAKLEKEIAELTVGSAFSGSAFVSGDLTLTAAKARVIYGTHFEYKEGKVVGYDKPVGASDRTLLVSSTGEALSFDEALRALVEKDPDRDRLLRAKARAGAGSSTVTKGAKAATDMAQAAQEAKLSGAAKISAGLKKLAKAS